MNLSVMKTISLCMSSLESHHSFVVIKEKYKIFSVILFIAFRYRRVFLLLFSLVTIIWEKSIEWSVPLMQCYHCFSEANSFKQAINLEPMSSCFSLRAGLKVEISSMYDVLQTPSSSISALIQLWLCASI